MIEIPPLVLASASPRRRECLDMLGLRYTVHPARISEHERPGESAVEYVERLAQEKALTVAAQFPEALVLAGDTVVVVDNEILGKPEDSAEAKSMLIRLSGRSHTVASGVALAFPPDNVRSGVSTTEVVFRPFQAETASAYVATGEPLDKAGAYAIQGLGASLVSEIAGDYYTVVGLPVPLFFDLLRESGWEYSFGSLVGGERA
ncbi:MAG: Maf family protein [Gemmatimonadota bacterium]|nr:Maf family protein [Gemmatimonadota bacterium]